MSQEQPNDTDLINEVVATFGQNQAILADLIKSVDEQSRTNLDPIAQVKLKELRRAVLVSDVEHQTKTIELISNTLKEICLPMESLNV